MIGVVAIAVCAIGSTTSIISISIDLFAFISIISKSLPVPATKRSRCELSKSLNFGLITNLSSIFPSLTAVTDFLIGRSERYSAAEAALSANTCKSASSSVLSTITVICVG